MAGVKGRSGGKRANTGGSRPGAGRKKLFIEDDLRGELKATADKYQQMTGKSVADCLMDLIYGKECSVCGGTGKVSPIDDCDLCKGSGQMGADPKTRATAIKTFLDTQIVKQSHTTKDVNIDINPGVGPIILPALNEPQDDDKPKH